MGISMGLPFFQTILMNCHQFYTSPQPDLLNNVCLVEIPVTWITLQGGQEGIVVPTIYSPCLPLCHSDSNDSRNTDSLTDSHIYAQLSTNSIKPFPCTRFHSTTVYVARTLWQVHTVCPSLHCPFTFFKLHTDHDDQGGPLVLYIL